MTIMVGTPRITFHIEAETEDCTCPRVARCGGIETVYVHCPEHGGPSNPVAKYHTHAVQTNRVTSGRAW